MIKKAVKTYVQTRNPVRVGVSKFLTSKPLTYVQINLKKIKSYAKQIYKDPGLYYLPEWKNREGEDLYPDEDWNKRDIIDYFCMINAVNFVFWDVDAFGVKRYRKYGYLGSEGMFAAVKYNFNRLKPKALIEKPITYKEMKRIFGDLPMLRKRMEYFNKVASILKKKGCESFADLFKGRTKAFNNGRGLVEVLYKEMPEVFDDYGTYKDLKFHILKRAQFAISMIYARLGPEEFRVDDVDEITIFANYQLPKVLENLGVLEYRSDLKQRVEHDWLVKSNSVMENEIRTCTILACDLIVKEVNKLYEAEGLENKINALNIDAYLWYIGHKLENLKFARVRTTAY
jgi:hypothetical protein